jgi:hypothetical protein
MNTVLDNFPTAQTLNDNAIDSFLDIVVRLSSVSTDLVDERK